jgi:hypothetical protein
MNLTRRQFVLIAGAAINRLRAEDPRTVKARRKPNDEWREYPTRTLDRVTGFQPVADAAKTDAYGGRLDRKQRATGFFYPAKLSGRWYLIDPAGNPYIQAGICSLTAGRSATNRKNLEAKFGTPEKWAAQTSDLLRSNGFTGCGAWSDVDLLRTAPHRLVYCTTGNFMGDFGRSQHLTQQQAGHLGYANDFIPVFRPNFEAACDAAAQKLAATKDDPFLLGHFSDNELPAPPDLLDRALRLDSGDPGRKAAEKWLAARKSGAPGNPGDDDREAFRGQVYNRYFQVTTAAIRKYDPNHLCLGPRMHGPCRFSLLLHPYRVCYAFNSQPLRRNGFRWRFASSLLLNRRLFASHMSFPGTRRAIAPNTSHSMYFVATAKSETPGAPPLQARIQSCW